MNLTIHAHDGTINQVASLVTFKDRLTALGGRTSKVEVYDRDVWDDSIIPDLPGDGSWSSLAVADVLYIFAKSLSYYGKFGKVWKYRERPSGFGREWEGETPRTYSFTSNHRSFYFNNRIFVLRIQIMFGMGKRSNKSEFSNIALNENKARLFHKTESFVFGESIKYNLPTH